MTGLVRIDARHVARSPLLWLGALVAAVYLLASVFSSMAAQAGNDVLAQQSTVWLAGGAVLAGAWLGLRDSLSGVEDALAVTPTPAWRLELARVVAASAAATGVFCLLFAIEVGVTAALGGRGGPSLRLVLDAVLATVLAAVVGLAVGRLTRSRMVALFTAPTYVALVGFAGSRGTNSYRLSPTHFLQQRSAVLGFVPDLQWGRIAYLAGLVAVVVIALVLVRDARARTWRVATAALVAASVTATAAVWLLAQPAFHEMEPVAYRGDDATTCARGIVEVCVFPAYGQAGAERLLAQVEPMASLLAGVPGLPRRARMVPPNVDLEVCAGGEAQINEDRVRFSAGSVGAEALIDCLLPPEQRYPDDLTLTAAYVVGEWLTAASDDSYRQSRYSQTVEEGDIVVVGSSSAEAEQFERRYVAERRAVGALLALPTEQVLAELEPLWDDLRAGTLSIDDLPAQS